MKNIISKIKKLFKHDFLEEKDLKNLLSKHLEINYKRFYVFCRNQNVKLNENDIWNEFITYNLSIHVNLIKATYMISDGMALRLVVDSLDIARNSVKYPKEVDKMFGVELKRVK